MWFNLVGFDIDNYIQPPLEPNTYEYQVNYMELQKQIIIEDYFKFVDWFERIRYARGCMGDINCGKTSFDCAGMMKAYAIIKGVIPQSQISRYNSQKLYELGNKKDPRTAERWDFTYRQSFKEVEPGRGTHFAVITRPYSWWSLRVMDFIKWYPAERELKVYCNKTACTYLGKYLIYISSNWLIEESNRKNITVDPFEELKPYYTVTTIGSINPTLADQIATYRYNENQDRDMIETFYCESRLDPEAIGKLQEEWVCQLIPNRTNNVRLENPARKEREYQARICMEKREAVRNKNIIRACYNNRKLYSSKIIITEWRIY